MMKRLPGAWDWPNLGPQRSWSGGHVVFGVVTDIGRQQVLQSNMREPRAMIQAQYFSHHVPSKYRPPTLPSFDSSKYPLMYLTEVGSSLHHRTFITSIRVHNKSSPILYVDHPKMQSEIRLDMNIILYHQEQQASMLSARPAHE